MIRLDDISIRTDIRPGDLGYVIHLHGALYHKEYGYGLDFERYIAEGVLEFWQAHDPAGDRVWICEHGGGIVGSLFLEHRADAAQLRYFLIRPEYRGIGLGNKLMALYLDFFSHCGYGRSYLWTTQELSAATSL